MRGRHDNHQPFEVPAANGSRPIAGGRLCGGKVSELFRTGEWICRRGNSCREILDRLLLFGWLLSQRDPIELSCEGVMRQPGIAGLRPCRTSRSIASNRPLAIERANHGVVGNHRPSLKFNRKALRNVSSSIDLLVRSETTSLQNNEIFPFPETAPERPDTASHLASVRHTTVSMSNPTDRVEIITSVQRRRPLRRFDGTFEP